VRDLADHLARAGAQVRWAPLAAGGVIDTERLAPLIDSSVALVSIQAANNETGAIQPVRDIARLCRAVGVPFHCDAVQWAGKLPLDVTDLGVDLLTISPHKFHGPKGAGLLWVRPGVRVRPVLQGAQELGRRGGTENVPGIAGAGAAADRARAWLSDPAPRDALAALRDEFESIITHECPQAVINRPPDPALRLWNTSSIAFPGLAAEALLVALSERGVCASAGAACSSGSLEPSPVLLAMGVPEPQAHGSLRFSLSRDTTRDEIRDAAAIIAQCVRRMG
jgi:cysteine desulfurase